MSRFFAKGLPAVALLAVLPVLRPAAGQEAPEENVLRLESRDAMPPATLEDVAWLEGHWRGEMFGGTAEAIWSPPMGGSMMGAYRLVEEGEVTFYELLVIVPEAGSLVMKIKHFRPDLTGWEERDGMVEFPLVKVTPNEIFFDGLTYVKIDENTRNGFLLVARGDEVEEVRFTYRRVEK